MTFLNTRLISSMLDYDMLDIGMPRYNRLTNLTRGIGLPETNTLSYFMTESAMKKKSYFDLDNYEKGRKIRTI